MTPRSSIYDRSSKTPVRQFVSDVDGYIPKRERDDLRRQAKIYGGVSEHVVDRLCDVIDGMEQMLPDTLPQRGGT